MSSWIWSVAVSNYSTSDINVLVSKLWHLNYSWHKIFNSTTNLLKANSNEIQWLFDCIRIWICFELISVIFFFLCSFIIFVSLLFLHHFCPALYLFSLTYFSSVNCSTVVFVCVFTVNIVFLWLSATGKLLYIWFCSLTNKRSNVRMPTLGQIWGQRQFLRLITLSAALPCSALLPFSSFFCLFSLAFSLSDQSV